MSKLYAKLIDINTFSTKTEPNIPDLKLAFIGGKTVKDEGEMLKLIKDNCMALDYPRIHESLEISIDNTDTAYKLKVIPKSVYPDNKGYGEFNLVVIMTQKDDGSIFVNGAMSVVPRSLESGVILNINVPKLLCYK